MELLRAAALALTLGALGACSVLRDATPLELEGESVVVHALLETGADTVAVVIRRVRPARGFDDTEASAPVAGARVRVRRGTAEAVLVEGSRRSSACRFLPTGLGPAGCYVAALPGGVRAGERHELHVELPGGGVVTGAAVPPGRPVLLRPVENERFVVAPGSQESPVTALVPLRWDPVAGAAGVDAAATATAVFEGGHRVEGATCVIEGFPGAESASSHDLAFRIQYLQCGVSTSTGGRAVRPDSVQARLTVAVYDTAYTRYRALRGSETLRAASASVGLAGAPGVFGGVAEASRSITLVVTPAPAAGGGE